MCDVISDHFTYLSKIKKFSYIRVMCERGVNWARHLWMKKYQFTCDQAMTLLKMIYCSHAFLHVSGNIVNVDKFNDMIMIMDSVMNMHNVVFDYVFTVPKIRRIRNLSFYQAQRIQVIRNTNKSKTIFYFLNIIYT